MLSAWESYSWALPMFFEQILEVSQVQSPSSLGDSLVAPSSKKLQVGVLGTKLAEIWVRKHSQKWGACVSVDLLILYSRRAGNYAHSNGYIYDSTSRSFKYDSKVGQRGLHQK